MQLTQPDSSFKQMTNNGYLLHLACRIGNLSTVKKLISAKCDVNVQDEYGRSPLHVAVCSSRNTENIVCYLIQNKADIEIKTKTGDTAAVLAVRNQDVCVLRHLISAGCTLKDREYGSLLTVCMEENTYSDDIVNELLVAGVELLCPSASGYTALEIAAKMGHTSAVYMILRNMSDCVDTHESLRYALYAAIRAFRVDIVCVLLQHIPDSVVQAVGEASLVLIAVDEATTSLRCTMCKKHVVQLLIDAKCPLDTMSPSIQHGSSPLLIAAEHRLFGIAEDLMHARCSLDNVNAYGETALMLFVRNAETRLSRIAITCGANCNILNFKSQTALHYSATVSNVETTIMLCKHMTQLSVKDAIDLNNYSALMMSTEGGTAADLDCLRALLEGGCNPNGIGGGPVLLPLEIAIRHGCTEAASLLLRYGASTAIPGSSLLDLACQSTNKAMIRLMLPHCQVSEQVLITCLELFNTDALYLLLEHAHSNHIRLPLQNIIWLACFQKNESFACTILEFWECVDLYEQEGYVARRPPKVLMLVVRLGKCNVLKDMLACGWDINAMSTRGEVAVEVAARYGNHAIVQLLIERKCNVNQRSIAQGVAMTALSSACYQKDIGMVCMLLKAGADISVLSGDYTPIYYALKLNPDKKNTAVPTIVSILLEAKCDPVRAGNGQLNLVVAVQNQPVSAILQLLSMRCDVNGIDQNGYTPIFLAVRLNNDAMVKELIRLGANCNSVHYTGDSLLSLAAEKRDAACLCTLLSTGLCDTELPNSRLVLR